MTDVISEMPGVNCQRPDHTEQFGSRVPFDAARRGRAICQASPFDPSPPARTDRVRSPTRTPSKPCTKGWWRLSRGKWMCRRGGIGAAIAAMRKGTTPGVLIVDISDEKQPLTALAQLADVVEPDVSVLVTGQVDSVDFYREITRNLGASGLPVEATDE